MQIIILIDIDIITISLTHSKLLVLLNQLEQMVFTTTNKNSLIQQMEQMIFYYHQMRHRNYSIYGNYLGKREMIDIATGNNNIDRQ